MSHLFGLMALVTSQFVIALTVLTPSTGDREVALLVPPWRAPAAVVERFDPDVRIVRAGSSGAVWVVEIAAGWEWRRLWRLGALPLRPSGTLGCLDVEQFTPGADAGARRG